ncbi:hypothetical protein SAMN05661008_01541 [Alkalithermobacter thermoalcaliphilus JW-YL-7 = DSM 7308]|uniref:Helix-turn-helix domain protein n=1 Tax=Alkalithermobacter thermoalcaliphilus JW-YL-7 = DSM 7308 TaxID=1121328 RepID=A0A150FQX5_CLOPD|nr:helix-turn-helix domain protein [[Clostridium] paradoxum JW-YL-7 = DSM 7308]SHL14070.1 hypothetical protein SAMN05661008_01541 [[Clostridium] paradoxum JW-YL-7 = DSM 7308]
MLNKKEKLFKNIKDMRSITIVGKSTQELKTAYFSKNPNAILEILGKYNIDNKLYSYKDTAISVYFTRDQQTVFIFVKIKGGIMRFGDGEVVETPHLQDPVEEIKKIIDNLLEEVYDFYQVSIPLAFAEKIATGEGLSFSDMLMLIPCSQTDLSKQIGREKTTISDYKAGRKKPSIEVFAKLVELYPFLPWRSYLKSLI